MTQEQAESRALVVAPRPAPMSMDMVRTFAQLAPLFIKQGGQAIPKSITTPEQAVAVMTLGAELGIGPVTAFGHIAIINGNAQPMAQLMMAVTRARDPSANFTFPDYSLEKMTCVLTRARFAEPVSYSIGLKDVPAATKKGPVWATHPLDMLQWFVAKRVCRLGASDLILVGGGLSDDTAPESEPADAEAIQITDVREAAAVVEPVEEVEQAAVPAPEPDAVPDDEAPTLDLVVKAVLTEGGARGLKTGKEISRWLGLDPLRDKPLRSEWFGPAVDAGVPYSVAADLAINCLGQVAQEVRRGVSTMAAVATVDPLGQLRALRETQAQAAGLPIEPAPVPVLEPEGDPGEPAPAETPVEAS